MSKKDLSEADICDRHITPALYEAGWKKSQIRREYGFTDGQMIVRGQMASRKARKRADYLLYYPSNQPIAVIEAKDNNHSVRAGIQQALGYAETLQIPFVFSSNGDGFLFHDKSGTYAQVEQQISLDAFPSPEELWQHYKQWKALQAANEDLLTSPYFIEIGVRNKYQKQACLRIVGLFLITSPILLKLPLNFTPLIPLHS